MWIISLLIVGFGSPALSSSLSVISSVCGFALVYNSILKIEKKSQRFILSAVWYGLAQAIALAWMFDTTYQGAYTIFVCIGLIVLLGCQFGCFSLFLEKNMSLSKILALAGFWAIMEWLRLFFICGYVFNPSGLTLTYHYIPMQIASIGGVFLLSFLVTLTNLAALRAIKTRRFKFFFIFGLLPYVFWGALFLCIQTIK